MRVREYGDSGPFVIVLHGGPGVAGQVAPVARDLAEDFRVLEPWQRGSSADRPCTVAGHVEDLDRLIESRCEGARPALVGWSWGAMLALAYAAAHPGSPGPLVLIGCGTFDSTSRERLRATLDGRMDTRMRDRLERLSEEIPDPDERLRTRGRLIFPLYCYDPITTASEVEVVDARAHEETWADMLRLQEEDVYPAAFAMIETPILMLHGAHDPHPGRMIRATLQPHLPQLEYHEWERCGHYPWLERAVREEFFEALRSWLAHQSPGEHPDVGGNRTSDSRSD